MMKRPGGPARSNLAEDSEFDSQGLFDDEVLQVMRHEGVVSGRRIHTHRFLPIANNDDGILTLTSPMKLNLH